MGIDLEALGRLVRETWVTYCLETGDTKPSHVAPWEELSDWDKEADRRIGGAIARHLGAGHPVAADRAALVERIGVTAIAHYSYVDEKDVDLRAGTGNDGETWGDLARSIGVAAIAVVEAAGWGPRAEPVAGTGETLYRVCPDCRSGVVAMLDCDTCRTRGFVPVAPPEPLSAEEIAALTSAIESLEGDEIEYRNMATAAECDYDENKYLAMSKECGQEAKTLRDWLAALPARFAVPVEGA